MEGKVKGEMVLHFWYKVTPMSASGIHTTRIGLATCNQSALSMMSINRYYVKCLLYSVDSTASQQPASLQLQDIEDTSNDYIYGWCYILLELELCAPPGRIKKFRGQIYGESCKCTPRQREHPRGKARVQSWGNWGDLDGGRGYLGSFSVCFEGDD